MTSNTQPLLTEERAIKIAKLAVTRVFDEMMRQAGAPAGAPPLKLNDDALDRLVRETAKEVP